VTRMPNWDVFMIPTLSVLSDGLIRHSREFYPLVADQLGLSEEQRNERLGQGDLRYLNRAGWAVSFLTNIGALSRPRRAHYQITDAGRQVLELFPNGVHERDLKALADDPNSPIRAYQATTKRVADVEADDASTTQLTPTEQVQAGIERINEEVASDLLSRLQGKEPAFFEQAVVDLLLAMGYGGTEGTGSVTPYSNDGGIDGVIDQDILGLSRIYIQAKRYKEGNAVGRPELQAFVGALSGRANQGVFITTSRFSDGARTYTESVPTRIVLIDGERLAQLMIRYGVGVQVKETYKVVEVDEDFFS